MAQHPRFQHTQRSAVLVAVLFAMTPDPGHTDELVAPSDQILSDELQLLREEESVSTEPRGEQPISRWSSGVYVMIDEDIRESGVADLPSLLRQILGFDAPVASGSEINRGAPTDSQFTASRLLVVVDGRTMIIDTSNAPAWKTIPATLPDIKRLEVWRESASAVRGGNGDQVVIRIITKTPGK